MYLAQGYNALHAYAQENIFTTPERQRVGRIAAGVCAITTAAVTARYFLPPCCDELNRRMSLACLRSVSSLTETLPQSLQLFNATHILERLPQSSDSCLVLTGLRLGKFVAGAYGVASTSFFMEKAGWLDWLKEPIKQKTE